MGKYIFWRYRKLIITAAVVILLPIVSYLLCYGFIFFSYNYAPESVSDTIWSMQNPPNVLFIDKGVSYKEFGDGLILRTDLVRDSHGRTTRRESVGVRGAMGHYYYDALRMAMLIHDGTVDGRNQDLYYFEVDGQSVIVRIGERQPTSEADRTTLNYYRYDSFVSYYLVPPLSGEARFQIENVYWTAADLAELSREYTAFRANGYT